MFPVDTDMYCRVDIEINNKKKNPTSISCMLIKLRIPFLVSLSAYEALISDRKMRRVLKLYCTSLYS